MIQIQSNKPQQNESEYIMIKADLLNPTSGRGKQLLHDNQIKWNVITKFIRKILILNGFLRNFCADLVYQQQVEKIDFKSARCFPLNFFSATYHQSI